MRAASAWHPALDKRDSTGRIASECQSRTSRSEGRRIARRTATAQDGVVEFDERRAKMERLRAEGIDPYPPVTLWDTRTRIADVLAAHDPAALEPGEHPELRYRIAGRLISRRGHGKTAFLDVRDLSGSIQVVVRVDTLGEEDLRPHPEPRHRRHRQRRRVRVRHPARTARARGAGVHAAHEVAAAAARQAPRARRHRHPLPLPRARPDRQRGDARAVRHAQQDRRRDPRMARRAQLRRGRNPGAAVARRRRGLAPVHDPPQRARPRPLPAHLGRAVPEPLHRRRAWRTSTTWARCSATRASRRSTPPSSRSSSSCAPTPTTTTWRR